MPLTDDFDQNPDLTVATIRHTSALMCENLRRLSTVAARHPHLTPQQALLDAATMFERAMEDYITRLGTTISTKRH